MLHRGSGRVSFRMTEKEKKNQLSQVTTSFLPVNVLSRETFQRCCSAFYETKESFRHSAKKGELRLTLTNIELDIATLAAID